jgi:hypothetical protein
LLPVSKPNSKKAAPLVRYPRSVDPSLVRYYPARYLAFRRAKWSLHDFGHPGDLKALLVLHAWFFDDHIFCRGCLGIVAARRIMGRSARCPAFESAVVPQA